jgi:hypothetical protein
MNNSNQEKKKKEQLDELFHPHAVCNTQKPFVELTRRMMRFWMECQ